MTSTPIPTRTFYCKKCNRDIGPEWAKFCPHCRSFNTISPGTPPAGPNAFRDEAPQLLSDVKVDPHERIPTGTREFDRVLGGGLVIGSAVLLSGDPGIGKSTLLLQTAIDLSIATVTNKETGAPEDPFVVLYVSAEETKSQVRGRADRLAKESKRLYLFHHANVLEIEKQINDLATLGHEPDVLIIDSIQTMMKPDIDGTPGSVSQVRACTDYIIGICKSRGIGCFIVAHITKEGTIAGPKTLEHLVDATLEFHKEGQGELRSVSASKNRFGSTNETALFRMTKDGLHSIENPSELLISHHKDDEPGSCLGVSLQGQRAVVVEVQSLIAPIVPLNFEDELRQLDGANARQVMAIMNVLKRLQKPAKRNVTGVPSARVNQVMAVLARHVGVDIREETWLSVAGGIKFDEPGLDLPVALSLASFVLNTALPPKFVAFGEIGLLGEIRPVEYMDVRIKQAATMGYEMILGPLVPKYESDLADVPATPKVEGAPPKAADDDDDEVGDGTDRYIGVQSLEEAFEQLGLVLPEKKAKQAKKPRRKNKRVEGHSEALVPITETQ